MLGKLPPVLVPCTKGDETRVCQLTERTAAYNDLLWHLGLEIREEGEGELAIASPPGIRLTELRLQQENEIELIAVALLNDIVAEHRCIVSVEINFVIGINPLLLNILQDRCNLLRLRIVHLPSVSYWEENMVTVLKKLAKDLDKNDAAPRHRCYIGKLPLEAPRQQSPTSLTTLDVGALEMSGEFAQQLFDILQQSNTISDLTVGACVFTSDRNALLECFVAYLKKEGTALKALTIIMSKRIPVSGLQSLVAAILSANTLENLVIETDTTSIYSAEQNALFAALIAQNSILRGLSVTCPSRRSIFQPSINTSYATSPSRIDPWLLGLQKNTRMLALAVDLVELSNEECCAFFSALTLNNTLKDIKIRYLPPCADIKKICTMIRQSRLANIVYIEDCIVTDRSLSVLPECPEMTCLTISFLSPDLIELCRRTLKVLSSCTHVVSLRTFWERSLLTQAQDAIAAYIAEASTLKNISVVVFGRTSYSNDQQQDLCVDGPLADALSSNTSLIKMEVENLELSAEKSGLLASAIIKSQTLTELSFSLRRREINDSFLDMLSSGIEKNYSLLRVDAPVNNSRDQPRAIRKGTARNTNLVARGARFVMGDHSDYCAQAIELVSGHPSVRSTVQESAGVQADQAEAMIRRALRLPCLTGLDDYMRLTGVVKKRVECYSLTDGTPQFDDLNYECWLHIRKFLSVADVVKTDYP